MTTLSEISKRFTPRAILLLLSLYILFGVFVYVQADPGTQLKIFLFEFTKAGGLDDELPQIDVKNEDELTDLQNLCLSSLKMSAEQEAQAILFNSVNAISSPNIACSEALQLYGTKNDKVAYARSLVASDRMVEARAIFHELASNGEPHSNLVLGFIYSDYRDRRPGEALHHFLQAYLNGEPLGAYGLGIYFELGLHDLPDYVQAATMYRQVSDTLPDAQFRLAQLYEYGLGVEKHQDIALDLYRSAAASGHEAAITHLSEPR